MDRKQFEMRYGFVPVFDTKVKKRRSIAPHLAKNKAWMEKHGFILIEQPQVPPVATLETINFSNDSDIVNKMGEPQPVLVGDVEIPTKGKTEDQINKEVKSAIKRQGRPKKQ